MESFNLLLQGFETALAPGAIVAMLLGVFVGSLVGALPGIGPVGAMAVLLPLSFSFDPTAGLLMMIGIFLGAQYGGSTTSILMNVPGEASSVVTAIDGHEMTKRGRAGAALAVAAIGSFIAGTIAVVLLQVAAIPMSDLALEFAAPEYLALTVFALFVLSRLSGGSFSATMIAAGIGLLLAMVGLDENTGTTRFTFDVQALIPGVEITPVAVGLFGVAELIMLVEQPGKIPSLPTIPMRELLPTRAELRRAVPPMFRGGIIGFLFGLIPGPGGAVSTYASYMMERRISKHSEDFGHGAIEGVAGPESANNGSAGGALVPLLVLGVPFAAPTALLLAGFTIHGVTPGPLFVDQNPRLFWAIIAGMYVANIALLVLNLPLVSIFTSVLRIPRDILVGIILLVATVGTFAARNSLDDVVWMFVMGLLGYAMVKIGLPRPALMLAFVIEPLLERSLLQTLVLSNGNPSYLFSRPFVDVLLAIALLTLVAPLVLRMIGRRGVSKALNVLEDS